MQARQMAKPKRSPEGGSEKKGSGLLKRPKLLLIIAIAILFVGAVLLFLSFENELKNQPLVNEMNGFIAKEMNAIYPGAFPNGRCDQKVGGAEKKEIHEALYALHSACRAAFENRGNVPNEHLKIWLSERLNFVVYNTFNHEDIYQLVREIRKFFKLGVTPEFVKSYEPTPGFFLYFEAPGQKEEDISNTPFGYKWVGDSIVCENEETQCVLSSFDAYFINKTDISVKKPAFIVIETDGGGLFVQKLSPMGLSRRTPISVELHEKPVTRFRYRIYFGAIPSMYDRTPKGN
ncbi:MAG: hypothetical protein Kow0090_02310 [Myxococcota bacterium]